MVSRSTNSEGKRNSLLRKKRENETWLKYIMSVSHLWLGLLSSVVLFVVCLTGSIYAFRTQIENLFNYDLIYVDAANGPRVAIDTLLNDFQARFGTATRVDAGVAEQAIVITNQSRNSIGVTACYHPWTGIFLGTKNSGTQAFFEFILELHRFLLAGDIGKMIVGIAVLVFLYMLMSGFVLWFPKRLSQFKSALTIKWRARYKRLNYDLHRLLGVYSLCVLFLMAVTGLYVSFHWMKNGIVVMLGGTSITLDESNIEMKNKLAQSFANALTVIESDTLNHSPVSTEYVRNLVDSVFNKERYYQITFPNENSNSFNITSYSTCYGMIVPSRMEVSVYGKINAVSRFQELDMHEKFQSVAKAFHTGEIMGLPTIVLYFVVSLFGSSLPITGLIIWLGRRK